MPDKPKTIQLTPTEYATAEAYAVAHPLAPAQSRLCSWVNQAGMQPEGRRLQTADVQAAVAKLKRFEILRKPESGAGYQINPIWVVHFLEAAIRNAHFERLAAVIDNDRFAIGWKYEQDAAAMHLCWALVSGDRKWLPKRPPLHWDELLNRNIWPYLPNLPESWKGQALRFIATYLQDQLIRMPEVEDPLSDLARAAPESAPWLAVWLILQGRLEAAESLAGSATSRDGSVAHQSIAAFASVLRGDDARAEHHMDLALEAERGGSRKRILFPDNPCFALSLIALLRADTIQARQKLELLLSNAEKLNLYGNELNILRLWERKRDSDVISRVPYTEAPPLIVLLIGMALHWQGNLDSPANLSWREAMEDLAERCRERDFVWLGAELETVLRSSPSPAHQQLGTVSLLGVITQAEPWENSLKALELLAHGTRNRTTSDTGSTADTRLAWFVSETWEGVDLQAREQKLRKNGTWTKGRPVSLSRLATDGASMATLSAQDHAAVQHIRHTQGYWDSRPRHVMSPKGFVALAGHPFVFDGSGNGIEVVRREPELLIDPDDQGSIVAQLLPYPEGDNQIQLHLDSGTLNVLEVSGAIRALCDIIPADGLRLPESARERLLEAVSALAGDVRVHGSIGGELVQGRRVAGDPTPCVRLEPMGEGLQVFLQVEPVPGSGTFFPPGSGGEIAFVQSEGEAVQAERDLLAEREAAIALMDRCPALARGDELAKAYEFHDAEDCLELIEQLHHAEARCLWPKGEPFKVVNRATAEQLRVSIKSAAEWFEASGELEVNAEQTLSLARLMLLLEARSNSRFLPLGDGQFVALSHTFRQQLDTLQTLGGGDAEKLKIHALAAPALEDLFAESQFQADAKWQLQTQKLAHARAFEPEIPSTLQAELRPYQREGITWLARLAEWGVGALLADDMGLGKTLQTLAVLLMRAGGGPSLVVAPTSLVDNWQAEARRFAPTLNIVPYMGNAVERRALLEDLQPFDTVLTTYGVLQNDVEQFEAVHWRSLVVDEAQAIKNLATGRAKAVRRLDAEFRVVLTGTPIQNHLMDLHALFSVINPGLLGAARAFRDTYAIPVEQLEDSDRRGQLARLIAPFILRRTKTEVLDDLPPRTDIVRSITLSQGEATLYEALRMQAVDSLDALPEDTAQGEKTIQVLTHLTRLRLACCHPSLVQDAGVGDSAKLNELMHLLEELLGNQHKVLVFSQFVKHLKIIEQAISDAGIRYQYLDGQTPRKARTERVQAFQSGEGDVFLISLKAGGSGLNLTAADYVIHMDPWWNPAAEDQASDRAHRIGQQRPVTVYRLVAKGTIEEQIVALHDRKRDLADQLLEGADQAASLDADELLQLLRSA